MRKTIKGKIIVSFVMLMLLTLGGQVVFNLYFAKAYVVEKNKTQLEKLFVEIKEEYSDSDEVLYGLTQTADSVAGYSVQIYSDESMIYSSRTMMEQGPVEIRGGVFNKWYIPIDTKAYSETPEAVALTSKSNDKQNMILLQGKLEYEGEARYILISMPVEAIDNSITMFTYSSIMISTVILFFGIIIIVVIAKDITRPIRNIEMVSRKMARLDFSMMADEAVGTLELASLAESMNSMSEQLKNAISHLQEANDMLQADVDKQKRLDEMRRQFVANVSHEMKTPLALLQIYCENLKHNVDGIDKDEYCSIIIEETERLDCMVKDMLHASTIENGLERMHMEKINLSEVSETLLNTMTPMLESYRVKCEIEKDLLIKGDKKRIEEAMRNYMMNAISYVIEGGEIRVTLRKIEQEIRFAVYNDGEKIKEEEKEQLWESFYKSDKSRTRKLGKNAGLGLSIVKAIVEKHGGRYGVTNQELGVEFWFALPRKESFTNVHSSITMTSN